MKLSENITIFKSSRYNRKLTYIDWFAISITFIFTSILLYYNQSYFIDLKITSVVIAFLLIIGFIMLIQSFCQFINVHIYENLGTCLGCLIFLLFLFAFSDAIFKVSIGWRIFGFVFLIIISFLFVRKLIDYVRSLLNKIKEGNSKDKAKNTILFFAQLLGIIFTALQILKVFKII